MFDERELATVLAALRFWQRHGPSQPNSCWDHLRIDEQDALDAIRTGCGKFTDLNTAEIDRMCERLSSAPVRLASATLESEKNEAVLPDSGHIKRYVLYDDDRDKLASTVAYTAYEKAAEDADRFDNVIVVPLTVSSVVAGETGSCEDDETRCDCELPGYFYSGVPGIIARVENRRLVPGAKVERCDSCQRYSSDEAAYEKLAEMGIL